MVRDEELLELRSRLVVLHGLKVFGGRESLENFLVFLKGSICLVVIGSQGMLRFLDRGVASVQLEHLMGCEFE